MIIWYLSTCTVCWQKLAPAIFSLAAKFFWQPILLTIHFVRLTFFCLQFIFFGHQISSTNNYLGLVSTKIHYWHQFYSIPVFIPRISWADRNRQIKRDCYGNINITILGDFLLAGAEQVSHTRKTKFFKHKNLFST